MRSSTRWSCVALATALAAASPMVDAPANAATGHLIAFTAALSGPLNLGGIFVMRPDGSDVRQITSFRTVLFDYEAHGLNLPDDHPSFSPDGRKIVFTSNRDGGDFEIYVMDVNGANVRRLTSNPGIDTEPVFSPDGSRIAFASERDGQPLGIHLMDVDGTDVRRLTGSGFEENEPAWSPDGSMLAFTRVQGDEEKDVFVMRADGSEARQLTFAPGEDHDATFSPDGSEVVITSEIAGTQPFGDTWRVRVSDGSFLQNLTATLKQGGGDPAWSPDGSQVAFFKSPIPVLVTTQMWMVGADGRDPRKIANQGLVNVHPAWGPVVDDDGDGTPDYQQGGGFPGTSDVSLQLAASPEPVVTGTQLTYTATARNFGPAVAQGVTAIVFVPAGTSLAAVRGGQGSCSTMSVNGAPAVGCELGDLAVGATATAEVTVAVSCSLRAGEAIENLGVVGLHGVDAASANNSAEVTTTAIDPAPVIDNLSVDSSVLWPPSHEMRDVTVDYGVEDNCDAAPAIAVDVTSDEAVDGTGDGQTSPDWEVLDPHHVRLRAERDGRGDGRTYSVTVTATDDRGNSSRSSTAVQVPTSPR